MNDTNNTDENVDRCCYQNGCPKLPFIIFSLIITILILYLDIKLVPFSNSNNDDSNDDTEVIDLLIQPLLVLVDENKRIRRIIGRVYNYNYDYINY